MNKEELIDKIELLCEQLILALATEDFVLMYFLLSKLKSAVSQLEDVTGG